MLKQPAASHNPPRAWLLAFNTPTVTLGNDIPGFFHCQGEAARVFPPTRRLLATFGTATTETTTPGIMLSKLISRGPTAKDRAKENSDTLREVMQHPSPRVQTMRLDQMMWNCIAAYHSTALSGISIGWGLGLGQLPDFSILCYHGQLPTFTILEQI